MFQIKISLVVMPIMPHLLTPWQTTPSDISTATTIFQQKIVKSVTVLHLTENSHKLSFFLAGKANGKKGWFNVQNSNDRSVISLNFDVLESWKTANPETENVLLNEPIMLKIVK